MKIIVISGKNKNLVNELANVFANKGYAVSDSFLHRPKTDKWVITNITKYHTLAANPNVIEIQQAGIKATVHYIDIHSWGTLGSEIEEEL